MKKTLEAEMNTEIEMERRKEGCEASAGAEKKHVE